MLIYPDAATRATNARHHSCHGVTAEVEALIGLLSFVYTTDPSRVCCIYHATGSPTDGWANRKAYVCILGPETFLQNRTVICGLTISQAHGQTGYPDERKAQIQTQGPATQGNAQIGHPGGPQFQVPTQGRRGFFERMKDKLREL